ncbi:hypothetical protein ACHAPT_003832 [Fusarium lateritium]
MKAALFASIFAFGRLSLALPPPELLVLEPIDPDSGCTPHQVPNCCVPSMCRCKDGKLYLFNQENKRGGGTGCNPPWGYLGDTVGAIPGYCC